MMYQMWPLSEDGIMYILTEQKRAFDNRLNLGMNLR